jgi:N-acyl-D-aspartate/D-glutamate deacylase
MLRQQGRSGKAHAMLDIIIRGGKIIDGTGAPAFAGDVAILDGLVNGVATRRNDTDTGARPGKLQRWR